jgi:glycosyltransferase involved in cell wall biosynthesis
MKNGIAAIYNSFYDVDLLKYSAATIRPAVEKIIVVHQEYGFDGTYMGGRDKLQLYLDGGLIDSFVIVDPKELPENKIQAIITKRNIGLRMCQDCEYIIPMDNDEFYDPNDILLNKAVMSEFDLDTTYAPIRAYYGDTEHYFEDSYLVPFMYKNDGRHFERVKTKVLCDPAKKMQPKLHSIYNNPMHHVTYLPSSIENKALGLRNTANKDLYEQVKKHLTKWKGGKDALVFSNKEDGSPCLKMVKLDKVSGKEFSPKINF